MENGPKMWQKTKETLINYGLLLVQCVWYKNVNINNCSFFINNETCEGGRVSFSLFFVAFFLLFILFFYGPVTCLAFLTITIFTYMTKQLPNIQRGKRSLFPVWAVHFLPVNRQTFIYNHPHHHHHFVGTTQYLTASH